MDWRDHIETNPDVMTGKPVVRGTRLSVDFILGLLANGWSMEQILENCPTLTSDGLRAVRAFVTG